MKIENVKKNKTLKTEIITARVKPENKKWFKDNKISLDKLIEEIKK